MSNFFRNDLNLQNKWGHRLITIVFFIGFIVVLFLQIKELYIDYDFGIGKKINSVEDRLTSDLVKIVDLVWPNERLNYSDLVNKSRYTNIQLYDDAYCSKDIYKYIEYIMNKEKIKLLYASEIDSARINSIPLNIFSSYLKENSIYCLSVDSFGWQRNFLQPRPVFAEFEDYHFYKYSTWSTFIYFLPSLLLYIWFTLIISLILILIYYKIIIYIIYGKIQKK